MKLKLAADVTHDQLTCLIEAGPQGERLLEYLSIRGYWQTKGEITLLQVTTALIHLKTLKFDWWFGTEERFHEFIRTLTSIQHLSLRDLYREPSNSPAERREDKRREEAAGQDPTPSGPIQGIMESLLFMSSLSRLNVGGTNIDTRELADSEAPKR